MTKFYMGKYRRKYGKSLKELGEEYHLTIQGVRRILQENPEWRDGQPFPVKRNQAIAFCEKLYSNIRTRCTSSLDPKYPYYGGKGVQVHITLPELIYLWVRDKAEMLYHPSIDRLNSDGHYTLENCRFIEHDENRRRVNKA